MTEAQERLAAAQRQVARLRQIVYRAEKRLNTGRNATATERVARQALRGGLVTVVAIEDVDGVEAAAALSERLTDLRQRAMVAGLLSAADVSEIERQVMG